MLVTRPCPTGVIPERGDLGIRDRFAKRPPGHMEEKDTENGSASLPVEQYYRLNPYHGKHYSQIVAIPQYFHKKALS